MVDLALHAEEGPVLRQDIAERPAISADYVAQLFRHLRKAELVKEIKGPGGGYRLIRDPATITAGDVLRAVEGPVAVVHCVQVPHTSAAAHDTGRCLGVGLPTSAGQDGPRSCGAGLIAR